MPPAFARKPLRRLVFGLTLLLAAIPACIGVPIHAKRDAQKVSPDLEGLSWEWIDVEAGEDAVLRGIHVRREGPTVLLLYGSGMGIFGDSTVEAIRMLHDAGYAVVCCDYRGTGHSEGRWGTSRHLDDDARAQWEWVLREKGRPAGVFGISVGAIASAPLLSHPEPPDAAVLDRPVDPRTVVGRFLEVFVGSVARYVSLLLVHADVDVDMRACLAAAEVDTLLVLPEYDGLCPPDDLEKLTADLSPLVQEAVVPGGHLSAHLVEPVRWRSTVLDFLDERLRPGLPAAGGRSVPPDPARVVRYASHGRTLTVELDRDELPERITMLACGLRRNHLFDVEDPRREMTFRLPRRVRRPYGVRVVPEGFKPPIAARRVEVPPPE